MTDTSLATTDANALATLVPDAKSVIARAIADGDADTLFELRSRASAFELKYQRDGARETANDAGEIKVRAERALGQLDAEIAPHGGPRSAPPELAPLAETNADARAAWRKLGALEDAEFENRIHAARADEGSGVSTTRLLTRSGMGVHYQSDTPEWSTPADLFDQLNAEFGFTLDVCATSENTKCATFYDAELDGLAQPWTGVCWMNPPYGDTIGDWVQKARESAEQGATVVCLVPARVDTAWWWDNCWQGEIRFIRGRLKFGGGTMGAPFPSALVIFGREPNIPENARWER